MYSDIYSKLSDEERKVLEAYHKKIRDSENKKLQNSISSKKSTSASKNMIKSISSFSTSKNKDSSRKSSSRNPAPKSPSKRGTSASSQNLFAKYNFSNQNTPNSKKTSRETEERPNLQYEVERLLRAVYRHSVICQDFKEEIKKVGGIPLIDEYLKYRLINKN